MQVVTMYSTAACPFCIRAKQLLTSKGLSSIDEVRIDFDPLARAQMMANTGRRTVPQIYIGSTHVGGYDELLALDLSGELIALLNSHQSS